MFLQIILLNKITLSYSNTGVRSVNLTDMRFCYHSEEIRSTGPPSQHMPASNHSFKDYSFFCCFDSAAVSIQFEYICVLATSFLFLLMLYLLFSRAYMHDLVVIDCTRLREPPVIEPCFLGCRALIIISYVVM